MWHRNRPFPAAPAPPAQHTVEEARREQRATTERFIEAADRGAEVRRVSSEMRNLRIRNGYEELIEQALEPKRRR